MLNTIVLTTYFALFALFLLFSILAIRHTARFGYISQQFKALAWAFGIVALALFIFSVWLMINLYRPSPEGIFRKSSVTNINY